MGGVNLWAVLIRGRLALVVCGFYAFGFTFPCALPVLSWGGCFMGAVCLTVCPYRMIAPYAATGAAGAA